MRILVAVLLLFKLIAPDGYSQGCSDAGFCTIGTLKPHVATDSTVRNQNLSLIFPIGVGDVNVFVFTPGIQYENQISQSWSIQAKLTANYASGNLSSAAGPGDLFLSGTRSFFRQRKWRVSVMMGIKIPFNKSDLKHEGKFLPMQYQSSLGTLDIITGLSVSHPSWQFAFGWQQPLSGKNQNGFLPANWTEGEADKYPPSNEFNRKGDVLFRGSYLFKLKQKISFTVGLLGIYHLDKDSYVDESVSISPILIKGSQGLTLNTTFTAFWEVNDRLNIGFSAGTPFVVREVRPDGLTRSFVLTPEIRWSF